MYRPCGHYVQFSKTSFSRKKVWHIEICTAAACVTGGRNGGNSLRAMVKWGVNVAPGLVFYGRPAQYGWPSYFAAVVSIYLSSSSVFFFLAHSQLSQTGCLPHFHTWCGLTANLECRSEMCCTRLAANTGRKKSLKMAICTPSHKFVGYIFATKACIDNGKNI